MLLFLLEQSVQPGLTLNCNNQVIRQFLGWPSVKSSYHSYLITVYSNVNVLPVQLTDVEINTNIVFDAETIFVTHR